ncbi:hypothetical protein N7495_009727 [Penicillium taxi]|uniref:uncharacterized protein n=1 Tax=Penicillium taxi TaxID=168475 RepID=UPI002545B01F|nr:uncharacterized protein N7495_009727 [Penicillium taxi]KAJ5885217.1 hypothetical protein N7495_009727 [Penicillium taxi]
MLLESKLLRCSLENQQQKLLLAKLHPVSKQLHSKSGLSNNAPSTVLLLLRGIRETIHMRELSSLQSSPFLQPPGPLDGDKTFSKLSALATTIALEFEFKPGTDDASDSERSLLWPCW